MGTTNPQIETLAVGVADLAKALGVSPEFIRLEIRRGRIRPARLGRRVVIPKAEVDRYLLAGTDAGPNYNRMR